MIVLFPMKYVVLTKSLLLCLMATPIYHPLLSLAGKNFEDSLFVCIFVYLVVTCLLKLHAYATLPDILRGVSL